MNKGHISKSVRRVAFASLLVVLTMISPVVSRGAAPPPPPDDGQDVIILPPEPFDLPPDFGDDLPVVRHPKMDSALAEVALAAEKSMAEALSLAKARALHLSGRRVLVRIYIPADGVDKAVAAVRKAGGEVTGIGFEQTVIEGGCRWTNWRLLPPRTACTTSAAPPRLMHSMHFLNILA